MKDQIPQLPDILLINIIDALDRYAVEVGGREYGLPKFDEYFDEMMDVINQQIERHNQTINDKNQRINSSGKPH